MFVWLIFQYFLINLVWKNSEDLAQNHIRLHPNFLVKVCGCAVTLFQYQCKTAESVIFVVYYTKYPPYFLNQKGVDRLRKMSISWIFKVEMLENCRFVKVEKSEFRLSMIYSNFLLCLKVVPKGGRRNWTITRHRVRPNHCFCLDK